MKLRKTPRECLVPNLQAVDLGITVPRVTVVATEDDASISYKLHGGPAKDFTRLKMTQL